MIRNLNKKRIYHFIGIGGIGMSAIAEMLVNLGFQVTGSDINESYLTQKLQELGVTVYKGHKTEYVEDASFVVYSSAIDSRNPEFAYAQENKIPLVRRAEMLAELMKLKKGIAVGGTHGKTTTTSILATLLNVREQGASYVIGGVVKNLGGHSFLGDGEYLVAEADESDGSFVELSPLVSIVTNIDEDHMSYYQTRRNLEDNFLKFINKVPFYGFCVLNGDDKSIVGLLEGVRRPYQTFGIDNEDVDYRATMIDAHTFKVRSRSESASESEQKSEWVFKNHLSGKHNVYNALGAIVVARRLGYSWEELQNALLDFKGVGRRLEEIHRQDNLIIYDDYAHHPTEIKAVIESQKQITNNVSVVFQPHRYTRTQEQWRDFVTCFDEAKTVYLLPVYSANEDEIEGVNSVELAKAISGRGVNIKYIENLDKIDKTDLISNSEVILSLGAGSISRQMRIYIRELNE